MSTISSPAPRASLFRCSVCGDVFVADLSKPLMDFTCPNCGCFLMIERKDRWLYYRRIAGDGCSETGFTRLASDAMWMRKAENITDPDQLIPGAIVRAVAARSKDLSASRIDVP